MVYWHNDNDKYDYCRKRQVFRTFDCEKNVKTLQTVFNIITGSILATAGFNILANTELAFFTKIALLIVAVVGMDVLSTLIENVAPKINDWFFYQKLKRNKAKQEKIEEEARKAEELKRQQEEAARIANTPNYQKLEMAKAIIARLRTLSENYNYGSNEEKINICVEKCELILQKLQEDSSGYIRVIHLFEVYLPEFCSTLELYTNFVRAEAVTAMHEKILTECVDTILEFLESQRIKAIFDKASTEIKFQASAANLKDMLEEEIKK